MKSLVKYFVVLLIFPFSSITVEAQFIKKIQNAANRGVERAIEKKVEEEATKMTQRQLEKLFSDMYGDSEGNAAGNIDMSQIMKGLGEPVDTEDEYDFFGYLTLEMVSTNANGKAEDPFQLKSYLAESTDYTGMELIDPKNPKATTAMVFDVKNQASIVFLDNKGEKSSFAYKLDMDAMDEMVDENIESTSEDYEVSIEKTGNTKDILGYPCEEYHVVSEDGEGYYWITDKPIGGYASFWGSNSPMMTSKAQERYAQHFNNMPDGNFMELTFTSTDSEKIDMKVIEINESAPKSLTMAEYPNLMNSMKEQ
ncbi:hypothetical protein SAMN04489724_4249 [Algoriphagus locisalis]|uniref:DUF4412 domain-containing protein n=1 Tax=Algoriphagus locisalis TaxID=305507 RepID=A0A1I7DPG9_9BACT|nr:DUF4412 domain-containing protein [Algoriphagus locisalis]SFU13601.1 hypothetical protein SAMN04489724_4249 [Algoriphagus locisalis]